jgi:hypothetical protein
MALKQMVGLTLSAFGVFLGLWLAFFPAIYLRANVKYKSPKSWLTESEAQSPWWQLAFRLLGFGLLAFAAIYIYAILHSTH